jgi:anti-sigma factor RsiW
MRCKEAEKWMLRSLDGALMPDRQKELAGHTGQCPRCQRLEQEYGALVGALRGGPEFEPLPYFWNRLESRIGEREREEPLTAWVKWSLRAIPISLALIGFFLGAIIFVSPMAEDEMSQPEALLLQNTNPLTETNPLFEEEKIENKSLMIIFAGDERIPTRRYVP